jgi:hypothetical protein
MALGYPLPGQDPQLRAWVRLGMMDTTALRYVADGEGVSVYATRRPIAESRWRVVVSHEGHHDVVSEAEVVGPLTAVTAWLLARGWVCRR